MFVGSALDKFIVVVDGTVFSKTNKVDLSSNFTFNFLPATLPVVSANISFNLWDIKALVAESL